MKLFIAYNDDVFGGYGVKAAGTTEKDARIALYKAYRDCSKGWNDDGVNCKTRKAFEDEWGYHLWEVDSNNLAGFSGSLES